MKTASRWAASLAMALMLSASAHADFTFPPQDNGGSGYDVFAGTSTVVNLNNNLNSAGVTPGVYNFFSVTADWTAGGGNPWSSEARVSFSLNGGTTTSQLAPSNGQDSSDPITLQFNGGFGAGNAYDPSVDATLDLLLDQTFGGSDANWNNIVVTLLESIPLPPIDGTVTTNGGSVPGNTDNFNTAYDPTVQNLYWLEYTLTSDASSVTFDTEGSDIDTEIGVYNSNGDLLGNDDDGGTGLLSSLTLNNLTAGTYYIASGGYNVTFGDGFSASSSDAAGAGTLNINVTAVPEPTALGLLALVGVGLVIRRRR